MRGHMEQDRVERSAYSLEELNSASLVMAIKEAEVGSVENLIAGGADLDHVCAIDADAMDFNPAMTAALYGRSAMLGLLIAGGADVNRANNKGDTPALLAASLGAEACLRMLIDAGADVDARGAGGETATLRAANHGRRECLAMLIAAVADVDLSDGDGIAPLHCAAFKGHEECARMLLAAGADVDRVNAYGRTATMWAARQGAIECARALMERGADLEAVDQDGATAADLASAMGHRACADMLRAQVFANQERAALAEAVRRLPNGLAIENGASTTSFEEDRDGMEGSGARGQLGDAGVRVSCKAQSGFETSSLPRARSRSL